VTGWFEDGNESLGLHKVHVILTLAEELSASQERLPDGFDAITSLVSF
jgi:hypothetical protein